LSSWWGVAIGRKSRIAYPLGNQIVKFYVLYLAGQYIDDASITSKVKTALTRDPNTSAFDISVETYKGTVQLSGFVDTDAERRRAAQVAEDVSGVRSVRNDLRVKAR
jgi:osmotically-inducible protein OsmY